jgi:hypothetical protein
MSKFIKCEKCGKELFSQGFKKHIKYCDGTGISNKERSITGRGRNWLKGLSLPEETKLKIKNSMQERCNNGDLMGIRKWMKENPELHKQTSSKGGGLKKGCGKGKKGWYMGFWCDSSWELAFVIYHLDLGSNIKRNTEFFNYVYEGKNYKYYPDFILNNEYVEIKGYESNKAKEKKKQFPHKLIMYYSKEMKPILEYVINKYGKDFIKLYKND